MTAHFSCPCEQFFFYPFIFLLLNFIIFFRRHFFVHYGITKCIFSLANPWFLFSHPGCVSSPVCLCSLQPSQNLFHRPGHYTKVGATLVGGGGGGVPCTVFLIWLLFWWCGLAFRLILIALPDLTSCQCKDLAATPVLRHRLKKKKIRHWLHFFSHFCLVTAL